MVNIVVNSYGKDCIILDDVYYQAIKATKQENYEKIYLNDSVNKIYDSSVRPMFHELYDRLWKDLKQGDINSIIYKHHISFVRDNTRMYGGEDYMETTDFHQIIVDFIASMTDDYFVDLYEYLFPNSRYHIRYISYFE